jgi:hypothetical protein
LDKYGDMKNYLQYYEEEQKRKNKLSQPTLFDQSLTSAMKELDMFCMYIASEHCYDKIDPVDIFISFG